MTEKMFRIAGGLSESYFHECALQSLTPTDQCVRPGANAELLGFTLAKAGISYKIISKEAREKLFNGSASDALKAGIVDTSSGKYLITESRMKEFDFSYPVEQMEAGFVVAKRTHSIFESALVPIYNFDGYMWLAVLIAFVVLIIALFSFKMVKIKNQNKVSVHQYVSHGLIYGFHSRKESTLSGNMVALLLGITVLLTTRLYCASLLTVLLHPPTVAPFKDSWEMLDLVEKNQLSIVVPEIDNWYMQEKQKSNHTYYKRLRQATKSNPIRVAKWKKRLEMVKNGKFIMPLMNNIRTLKIVKENCQLTLVAGNNLPTYWVGFLFKKNSTWLPTFNEALSRTVQGVENLNIKYSSSSSSCKSKVVRGGRPLDVYALSGLGVMLLIGFMIGAVTLAIEKCLVTRKTQNKDPEQKNQNVDATAFT